MSAIVQGDKIENKYTFPRKLYTKSAWKNTIINLKNEKKKKREENMYVKKTGLSLNFVIVYWLEALESGIWKK